MTVIKLETVVDNFQNNNVVVFDVITLIDELSKDHDKQWREYALELIDEIEKGLIK
jgi:DNA-binding ferritin-like protein (Dps family)